MRQHRLLSCTFSYSRRPREAQEFAQVVAEVARLRAIVEQREKAESDLMSNSSSNSSSASKDSRKASKRETKEELVAFLATLTEEQRQCSAYLRMEGSQLWDSLFSRTLLSTTLVLHR